MEMGASQSSYEDDYEEDQYVEEGDEMPVKVIGIDAFVTGRLVPN